MNGNSLARMAWRNLWRNRRRTLVTLSSIAFGIFLAVIMTGFGDARTHADARSLGAVAIYDKPVDLDELIAAAAAVVRAA